MGRRLDLAKTISVLDGHSLVFFVFLFGFSQTLFYLISCVGLFALGAFICFLFKPLINEIIGKIYSMESERKFKDEAKFFV
jgi:hypothetical protein